MTTKKTFYVTTPIYYANADPHVGSAYTTIAADIFARWNRLNDKEVFFLTGLDEHGQKIQETAEKNGLNPKEFVDSVSEKYKKTFKSLNISNDNFIRTTNKEHEKEVQKILQLLYDKKFIYRGIYETLYCVGCEQYLNKSDLVDGKCPLHKKEPEIIKEEAYMFKLSYFQDNLLKLIQKGEYCILPLKKRNEMTSFIKEGLQDISISRKKSKVSWGIELPFDKNHTCYVWVDAFWNYLTGLKEKKVFDKFWPANLQLMANDIIRVHSTIWPALLLATGNKLPKTIFVHGYFIVNGQKMSKSLGNVISPNYLTEKYGADSLRYFVIRNISFGQDGDFSEQALIERHNNELANKLGNLISRVSALAEQKGLEKTKNKLLKKLNLKKIEKHFENYEIDKALAEIFTFIDICNEYIQKTKPWESKTDKEINNSKKILYELSDSIKAIGILLWPFMPQTSEKIAKQFNFKIEYKEIKKPLNPKNIIKKSEILFQKIDIKSKEKNQETKRNDGELTVQDIIKEDKKNAKKFHAIFSKNKEFSKLNKIQFSKFLKQLIDETLKDYKSIEETCGVISGFIQYTFNDNLDKIIGIAEELDLPKEHVCGDVFVKWDKIKKLLSDYINKFEQENNLNKEKHKQIEGIINMSEVNYQDWEKIDLRVGTIKKVEDIEGADKLYKLEVDLGNEIGKRTICAGIKKYYTKEKLKDKQIIVVVNLAPRIMKGIESKGMLLAAGSKENDICILISPEKHVSPGTKIN